MSRELVKVSVYINESDEWRRRPLYMEILRTLKDQGLSGGTVVRGVAGFTAKDGIHTSSLVDAGGNLPLVVEFIDSAANVARAMPHLKEMVGERLIVHHAVVGEWP
jgi:uncharacterized protein